MPWPKDRRAEKKLEIVTDFKFFALFLQKIGGNAACLGRRGTTTYQQRTDKWHEKRQNVNPRI